MGVRRTLWWCDDIRSVWSGDSLYVALLKYRMRRDRHRVAKREWANLVSSRTEHGTHLPIIDLDFPHMYQESTSRGHGHLYLNVEIPRWRWVVLMLGLRIGGVIEHGTLVWSLRRMGNFVRLPEYQKRPEEYSPVPEPVPTYWLTRRNHRR